MLDPLIARGIAPQLIGLQQQVCDITLIEAFGEESPTNGGARYGLSGRQGSAASGGSSST